MNANDIAPNLYEEWGLDRRDGAHELLVLLESKDLQLQQQGQEAEEPRRAQLRIAASVLGSARKRAEYDNACAAGLRPTWGDLGQLGAVGQWNPRPQQPQQQVQFSQFGQAAGPGPQVKQEPQFAQTASPYGSPYSRNPFALQSNPFPPAAAANAAVPAPLVQQSVAEISQRAGQDARIGMAILDLFFFSLISGSFGGALLSGGVDELSTFIGGGIIMLLYVLGTECWLGASPAKLLMGYTVRDVDTKERLSLTQSAKRQWWRLVNIVPGPGTFASWLGAGVHACTISEKNNRRGSHDEWANAEVVKRHPRK